MANYVRLEAIGEVCGIAGSGWPGRPAAAPSGPIGNTRTRVRGRAARRPPLPPVDGLARSGLLAAGIRGWVIRDRAGGQQSHLPTTEYPDYRTVRSAPRSVPTTALDRHFPAAPVKGCERTGISVMARLWRGRPPWKRARSRRSVADRVLLRPLRALRVLIAMVVHDVVTLGGPIKTTCDVYQPS